MKGKINMVENIKFNLIDNKGIIKTYVILDKFSKNNKNYLIYKEEGKEDLYTSLYEVINDSIKVIPIEDDNDYDIVDKYLGNI